MKQELLKIASKIARGPEYNTLRKNQVPLTEAEKKEAMRAKAVWHHGPNGKESCAVWKSVVNGKEYYCCNTHRAMNTAPTLKGAIKNFDFIKTTASRK